MKEMVYKSNFEKEVLYSGEYKGYKFVILSCGLHPTVYVENKHNFEDCDEADDYAYPHGGFTYCGKAHWDKSDLTEYIGWDYAHYGDYAGVWESNDEMNESAKKWDTPEIYEEVKIVIEQLINNKGEAK